jgi:hypothetical protein
MKKRSFIEIMRDASQARGAGGSVPVALLSFMMDDNWQPVWDRLVSSARLEHSLTRMKKAGRQEAAN